MGRLIRKIDLDRPVRLRDAIIIEVAAGLFFVAILFGAFALTRQGDQELARNADRNAALTVEGEKAFRCILRDPLPEQQAARILEFNRCYENFDELRERYEADGLETR